MAILSKIAIPVIPCAIRWLPKWLQDVKHLQPRPQVWNRLSWRNSRESYGPIYSFREVPQVAAYRRICVCPPQRCTPWCISTEIWLGTILHTIVAPNSQLSIHFHVREVNQTRGQRCNCQSALWSVPRCKDRTWFASHSLGKCCLGQVPTPMRVPLWTLWPIFWGGRFNRTFMDVSVFNPHAPSNRHTTFVFVL